MCVQPISLLDLGIQATIFMLLTLLNIVVAWEHELYTFGVLYGSSRYVCASNNR